MSPVPLNMYMEGARELLRVEIQEISGDLYATAVWDNGSTSAAHFIEQHAREQIRDAWRAVALDVTRPERHRREAIVQLEQIVWRQAHED